MADLQLTLEIRGHDLASDDLQRVKRGIQDIAGVTDKHAETTQKATGAQEGLSKGLNIGAESIARFAGALTGMQLGLSIANSIGEKLRDTIIAGVTSLAQSQTQTNAVGLAYGAQAAQVNRVADQLRDLQNVRKADTLEASLQAVTLQRNYGLSIEQTQTLIRLSGDLARVRGIDLASSFERLQSAIRGEGEAAEYLGLTLNANYVQQNAANGAYRLSYTTLTDAQRAQVLYNEALRQGSVYSGLASISQSTMAGTLDGLSAAWEKYQLSQAKAFGPFAIGAIHILTDALKGLDTMEQVLTSHDVGPVRSQAEQFQKEADQAAKLHEQLNRVRLVRDQATGKFQFVPTENGTAADVAIAVKGWQDLGKVQQQTVLHYGLVTTATNSQTLAVASLVEQIQKYNQVATEGQQIDQSFQRGQGVMGISDREIRQVADLRAGVALLNIEAGNLARRQSEMASVRRALQEAAAQPILEARDQGARREAEARLANLNKLADAEEAVVATQKASAQAAQDLEIAQRADVGNLQAQADAQTSILGHARELREIERDTNTIQDRRRDLLLEQTQLIARQQGLGASRALQDAQTRQQELQLTARLDPSQRGQVRQELRQIVRDMPRLELSDLQARRSQTGADRAREDNDLSQQIRNLPARNRQLDLAAVDEPQKMILQNLKDEAEAHQLAATAAQAHYQALKNAATDASNTLQDRVNTITDDTLPEPMTPPVQAQPHTATTGIAIQQITVNVGGNQVPIGDTGIPGGYGPEYEAAVREAAVSAAQDFGHGMLDYLKNRGLPTPIQWPAGVHP